MKIGSHVSNKGNEMLAGSVMEAYSYGANCFMTYLGAPQNTARKPIDEFKIKEMHELLNQYQINIADVVVHAPYIVNLAQPNEEKRRFAVEFLTGEVNRCTAVGITKMVLHPGAHVGEGPKAGIKRIAQGINEIIANTKDSKVVILLETMAGKGTECGRTFEEIKAIMDLVENQSRIGVCLDSCHLNDAGYDIVNNYEQVINDFDSIIGLKHLQVIHLNDSKNPLSSHKDRHANFGFGEIGFDALMQFVRDPRFKDLPIILETPYIDKDDNNSYPPYKFEIKMIRANQFNSNLFEEVINYYDNQAIPSNEKMEG